jgi:hypothetical protein
MQAEGLPPCETCGRATVRVGKLPRIGLHPLIYVYKCDQCRQIIQRSGGAVSMIGRLDAVSRDAVRRKGLSACQAGAARLIDCGHGRGRAI